MQLFKTFATPTYIPRRLIATTILFASGLIAWLVPLTLTNQIPPFIITVGWVVLILTAGIGAIAKPRWISPGIGALQGIIYPCFILGALMFAAFGVFTALATYETDLPNLPLRVGGGIIAVGAIVVIPFLHKVLVGMTDGR